MSTTNMLLRMVSFLVLLMPLMVSAENEEQKDKFAEAKQEAKEGDIHVIKLEDILNGKHSGGQKKSDTKVPTKEPVKKEPSEESSASKSVQNDEKKVMERVVKEPVKVSDKKIVSELESKPKPKPKPKPKSESKIEKKDIKPKIVKEKLESKSKPESVPVPVPAPAPVVTKVVSSPSPAIEKKPNKAQELDLLKAYSELMGATDQRRGRAKTVPHTQKVSDKESAGWLYLGKFSEGQWSQKDRQVLGLNGILPTINHAYSLRAHSNMRNGYPLKGKMPEIKKVLRAGNKVRVIGLHNSGRSGHYWAKVAW